ncbi:hypothetical protein GX48_07412 [Paracoccidioides brasiliensis]|nr:hypothetical protein GX48_07412 [Paracoccidioides brasiliensis]
MTTDGLQENAMMDKAKGDSPQDVMFAHASMIQVMHAVLMSLKKKKKKGKFVIYID